MRDRLAALTLACSLAVLLLTAGHWLRARGPAASDAGSLALLEGRGAPAVGPDEAMPWLPVETGGALFPVPVGVRSAVAGSPEDAERPPPVWLAIPALGVEAPVAPVGLTPDGTAVQLPPDAATVGWYRHGPLPGEEGSALLVGHVDAVPARPGVFFRLRTLEPGARLVVRQADGSERWFDVVARRIYGRDELPADLLFAREGGPILTLVTCGGAFDGAGRRYSANVVIVAVPAPPAPSAP